MRNGATPRIATLVAWSLAVPLPAQIAPDDLARYSGMVAAWAGSPGQLASRDMDMAGAFKSRGISPYAGSVVAWAATEDHARDFASKGKLVICASRTLLEKGASVAIVLDAGEVTFLLKEKNVPKSGVTLAEPFLKLARKVD